MEFFRRWAVRQQETPIMECIQPRIGGQEPLPPPEALPPEASPPVEVTEPEAYAAGALANPEVEVPAPAQTAPALAACPAASEPVAEKPVPEISDPGPPAPELPELEALPALLPVAVELPATADGRLGNFLLLSLDVETTGFTPQRGDRVVSISIVEVFENGLGERFERVVDPGRPIPEEATRVHGISSIDVLGKPTFAEIIPELVAFIGDRSCSGYNLPFDLLFLKAEFELSGASLPSGLLRKGVDVMRFVEHLRGVRMRLFAACAAYGVDLTALRAHSATDDAVASALLMLEAIRQASGEAFQAAFGASWVSIYELEDRGKYYDDPDLEAAWGHFEAKRYEEALARARAAIAREEALDGPIVDSLGYELAAIILRRVRRHEEERDLLATFLRRAVGRDPTREEMRILYLDPWSSEYQRRQVEGTLVAAKPTPEIVLGFRPPPRVGELAQRLYALLGSMEAVPETHEERLARCRTSPPMDHVLKELAVCLRKEFSACQKKDPTGASEILRELHVAAQRHAFLHVYQGTSYPGGSDDPEWKKDVRLCLLGHTAVEVATPADLDEVVLKYREVGYVGLTLLNKTDVARLVAAFGEPDAHLNVRLTHMRVWERLRKAARARYKAIGL